MNPGNSHHQGHALLSTMLLVALVSVLGANGFRNSLLETRIAEVDQILQLGFQQAESVMRFSEQELVRQHLSEHHSRQWLFRPVTYDVPKLYYETAIDSGPLRPPPKVTIQTISLSQDPIESTEPTEQAQQITAAQVDVTTYTPKSDPAVRLQAISRMATSTGKIQRIAWRRLQ